MLPKYSIVFHPDNIVDIIRIVFFQVLKDLKFNTSLMMKSLLVSDDLYSDKLIGFIVIALNCLTERSFTDGFKDFIPIRHMILHYNVIVATIVVETVVMREKRAALNLWRVETEEIDFFVVQDLAFLIV